MKKVKICKECRKEFIPCKKTSEFCSKSCAIKYRNKQKILDGTHNFYDLNRSKLALDKVNKGIHPFQKGNMSEEALAKKAKGISRARKKETSEHRHAWQNPKNFIENEYSRSISISKSRELEEVILYIADTDYPETFKIGWTFDLKIREKDIRTHKISNIQELFRGVPEKIILLEKLVKEAFFNIEYYNSYKSTEIFPLSIKEDIIKFINLQRLSL